MVSRFGFASLIPPGLEADGVDDGEDLLVVTARSTAATASYPLCGVVSHRVQSGYVRQPSDLPCAGRRVRLRLLVRRFRCGVRGCLREVFAERFDTTVLAERARRPDASKRSSTISAWRWAADRVPGLPKGSCCRSATTRYSVSCVDAPCRELSHWP